MVCVIKGKCNARCLPSFSFCPFWQWKPYSIPKMPMHSCSRHGGATLSAVIRSMIYPLLVGVIAVATLSGCDQVSQLISGEAKFKEDYIKECVADSQNATFGLFGTDNLGKFCTCTYEETRKTIEYKDWAKIKKGEIGLADARSIQMFDASVRAISTCAGSPSKLRQ